MKVLITGATGLIGSEIVKQCLAKGWTVHYLTRSVDKLENKSNFKGFIWDIAKNKIDQKCFEGVECIINLAGANIAKRWTKSYKKTIIDSRIKGLRLLRESLSKSPNEIKHIISASAIGVYPDSKTRYYKESAKKISDSFLGKVVKQWEAEVNEFNSLGLKVSEVRIGLVLSDKGGALPQMVKPINMYVGAAFGVGDQWQSWIHIKDLAAIFTFVAENILPGIYNGVAPHPVTNKNLTHEVAEVLKKPIVMPNLPKFIMKMLLGEMHILLYESQRVCSTKIEDKGFKFQFPNLKPALIDLLA